jgi:2-haloacid dehalogenase
MKKHAVVFDLGGVLLDWNPRHLFRKVFAGDELAMEKFLDEVDFKTWNATLDAGQPFAAAISAATRRHPKFAAHFEAFHQRWPETLVGPIHGMLPLVKALRAKQIPLYLLTNSSAETYPRAVAQFEFLAEFDGAVVSGRLGVAKPDPRIYAALIQRFDLANSSVVFIDDNRVNAKAAEALGIRGLHFTNATQLKQDLTTLGLL